MAEVSAANTTELLAPVPAAADYSVSADLWQRLESEIKSVSGRIEAGEDLMPDDVTNVRKLKTQVDTYVASFNKAMRDAQSKYKEMVEKRLVELGYKEIEDFVAKKRMEQTQTQDARIASKMEILKTISDGLLAHTERLKDLAVASELLPAFTARFPNVQSGAKNKDIKDWKPYYTVMLHAVTVMDTFFRDPKYEDAALLPIGSNTMRELLAYVKDGNEKHLFNVQTQYVQDQGLIRAEKMKQSLKTKDDGIARIRELIKEFDEDGDMGGAAGHVKTEQTWEEISLIVRLVNSNQQ